jgi:hypothetical protein
MVGTDGFCVCAAFGGLPAASLRLTIRVIAERDLQVDDTSRPNSAPRRNTSEARVGAWRSPLCTHSISGNRAVPLPRTGACSAAACSCSLAAEATIVDGSPIPLDQFGLQEFRGRCSGRSASRWKLRIAICGCRKRVPWRRVHGRDYSDRRPLRQSPDIQENGRT